MCYQQVVSPLDSTISNIVYCLLFQKEREKKFLTLYHTWDLNLQYSDPESMGRVTTPGPDLLDNLLVDLLTPCAGTLRPIEFTIHKIGDARFTQKRF